MQLETPAIRGRQLFEDREPTSDRLIQTPIIRFSEIISALSVALDITQGHPKGHCMRSCLIGMRIAESLKLAATERSALFYALLLKDLGCSSNAAKIAYLFGADDHNVKHSIRMIDWTNPVQGLSNCWSNCAPGGTTIEKLLKMAAIVRSGAEGARKITEIRCERGAEIARMLQLSESTAQAILDLDEHWNGGGNPQRLKGQEISLLGRICCLAQTVEVFHCTYGLESACEMALSRRGKWFDPELVDVLLAIQADAEFWRRLESANLIAEISYCEPQDVVLLADDELLDRIAEAFAQVVDAKSPWTFLHSTRVAEIAVGIAGQLECSAGMVQDIRRAGLLHDIGKLGVSNLILDKPGKPTAEEFAQIRKHAEYSHQILQQVGAFRQLASVAGAHHERLDGRGYHRGIAGDEIHMATRILTVADICEAMTAKRPYRDAMDWDQAQQVLTVETGKAVDGTCVEALRRWHDRYEIASRLDAQLQAVETLMEEI
jgi:putative nucleotidyltransferase with HDIG domain